MKENLTKTQNDLSKEFDEKSLEKNIKIRQL
jgi:hypothetical protein